ncbi:MAG: helix-turn-helix transcriptional regulator [Bacteroidaceae bacterium]|nr:helix-turn-helix transcriptional regulator [Bacteroidaceae bacterium]
MRERIRQLMESTEMTQQTFAEYLGISAASMSSIFNGRTKPTLNIVEAIKRRFPTLNTDWLVFGVGEMYGEASTPSPSSDEGLTSSSAVIEPGLPFAADEASQPLRQGALLLQPAAPSSAKDAPRREIPAPPPPKRTITEIRVFYDDQTYESFSPRK